MDISDDHNTETVTVNFITRLKGESVREELIRSVVKEFNARNPDICWIISGN